MRVLQFTVGSLFLICLCGCAPDLAQTPLGENEVQWKDYVKKSYGSWTPPDTIPPSDERDKAAAGVTVAPVAPPAAGQDINANAAGNAEQAVVPDTAAAAAAAPAAAAAAPAGEQKYTVKKGDSLYLIAKKVYGKGEFWPKIRDANPELKKADRLRAGKVLRIPALQQ